MFDALRRMLSEPLEPDDDRRDEPLRDRRELPRPVERVDVELESPRDDDELLLRIVILRLIRCPKCGERDKCNDKP